MNRKTKKNVPLRPCRSSSRSVEIVLISKPKYNSFPIFIDKRKVHRRRTHGISMRVNDNSNRVCNRRAQKTGRKSLDKHNRSIIKFMSPNLPPFINITSPPVKYSESNSSLYMQELVDSSCEENDWLESIDYYGSFIHCEETVDLAIK